MAKEGRRVYANDDGDLRLAEGDYGFHPKSGWQGRPFGCHAGGLSNHKVTVHEDRTITVYPSILLTQFDDEGKKYQWHGYLERGIWRTV